ncbi:DUF1428 domain-containing protein [Rhodovulum euryhalinum]|uniref:Uncharacterized protein YbaA (DUF1428 family) n=1 Tax=Rhodovulum euryhalinum TaxID=35805 RepID=A0A4R2L222_9RHOB|nr:DUF1428 domain-containing protein [Rhodovulum euryhalinum]TCO73095.1 uncharacterized protein YbaA (DUF1428 family) [Rhodovulum euryhalinum]
MAYVDGFVLAVPEANKSAYRAHAEKAWPLFQEFGALSMWECWGDDVPDGKLTSFAMAVKAEPGEAVVFSWMLWPDKAARDAGWKRMMEDPRMAEMQEMPFDGKRMIYGGFAPLVQAGAMA